MAEKSKILIIGGTGYIGKFVVEASAKSGHPTFALVRESTVSDPVKGKLIEGFKNSGVTLVHGDLHNHESLVKAIKQVDVVISTVGSMQLADQTKIIAAIKEAGNIKRFLPSEFGNDVDRLHVVEPAKSTFAVKPGVFAPPPPRDKAIIPGDGNPKAIFNAEHDIGTYTIKTVDDPRTLNKIVYIRPPKNIYSFNELVSLWEKKIGKTLERIYIPEEQVLKEIQEAPFPINIILSINHSVFVKGDQTNFEIEPSFGVEASELYPDVKYTTVEEYLSHKVEYYCVKFLWEFAVMVFSLNCLSVAIFNAEHDIGTYTIKTVDDPSTLNKIVYIRPPKNIYSFNELVSLSEKKIGKTLERIYIPEEQVLKEIQEAPFPINIVLSINHSVFVKGDHTNFEIEPSFGVEASELYPDVKYTTVEEYLSQFV
ncbi:hypothetical protein TEA_024528 [Camellia sinensis var. sinensis]|uniref:NmrA-like domain-containing protein n=1 Tax=Camellia sinensis var. sinensis TaxID=542762 RepID=A0A4S4DG20_CAMSN|nr:hypothetical protein TEA_024528 [Camellia sinensis var. sinensis]